MAQCRAFTLECNCDSSFYHLIQSSEATESKESDQDSQDQAQPRSQHKRDVFASEESGDEGEGVGTLGRRQGLLSLRGKRPPLEERDQMCCIGKRGNPESG